MIVKQIEVSSQFRQIYFYMSSREVNDLYSMIDKDLLEYDDDVPINEQIDDVAIGLFLNDLLDEELDKLGIYSISEKNIFPFVKIKRDKPFLGSVKFAILPEEINFALPSVIPNSVLLQIDEADVEEAIKMLLLNNNYVHYKSQKTVSGECRITYDLRYTKSGTIINEIPNLEYTNYDEDIDSKKFDKCRVGDIVILNSSEIVAEAKITKIEKKIVDELTDEIVNDINEFDCVNVEQFRNKIKQIITFKAVVEGYIYFILEFALQQSKFEIEQNVIDLYYDDEDSTIDLEENLNQIKHEVVLDYIAKIVDLRSDDELITDYYFDLLHEQLDYFSLVLGDQEKNVDSDMESNLLDDLAKKLRVLLYCQKAGIIKNIKLE